MRNWTIPVILSSLILTSCLGLFNSESKPKPVDFEISDKSPLTQDDYFKLEIDSFRNELLFRIRITNEMAEFQFPKDKEGHFLSGTAFHIAFLCNNKPIEGAGLTGKNSTYNYFGYNKWLEKEVFYNTDTLDLFSAHTIEFRLPMYAFNKLKSGTTEMEMSCSQKLFCSGSTFGKQFIDAEKHDTVMRYIRNYVPASLLSFKAKFKINVPRIFKTSIYGYGIELRNDSVYSPAGMDNTIWNSSYPDVYWTINFPKDDYYCSSDYQKSTALYDAKDTFYLYHYTPNDSISIGVWDHDNLSRDDYISYETFSLNQFPQNKNYSFGFKNVKKFDMRVVKEGYVNK